MPSSTVSTQEFATSLSRVPCAGLADPQGARADRVEDRGRAGAGRPRARRRAPPAHRPRRASWCRARARRRTPGRAPRRARPAARCPRRRRWTAAAAPRRRPARRGPRPARTRPTSVSKSMVITTSAPRTASAAESATVAPASASGSALSRVRFQTRSGIPAAAMLRAIPAPIVPVPSSATVGWSVIWCPSFGWGEVVVVSTCPRLRVPAPDVCPVPQQVRRRRPFPARSDRRSRQAVAGPGGHPAGRLHVAARRHHRQRRGAVDPARAARLVRVDPVDRVRLRPDVRAHAGRRRPARRRGRPAPDVPGRAGRSSRSPARPPGWRPTSACWWSARLLQGAAAGLLTPQNSGLIQQLFSGEERGRAFGLFGTTVGVPRPSGRSSAG